jgi:beta-glucosidase
MLDRRTMIASAAALAASSPALGRAAKAAKAAAAPTFPQGFLWGASTAPHQIEGNNTGSDLWFIENQQPTVFVAPSGDAANSLLLWEQDLDLPRAWASTPIASASNGRGSSRRRACSRRPCSITMPA